MIGQNNYANRDMVVTRLMREYETYGKLVIAVDFDNTIFDYHSRGLHLTCCISAVKKAIDLGNEVYIFTANVDHALVRQTCLELFGKELVINESSVYFDSRKPFYSLLLDDRAGLDSALRTLNQLNFFIEEKQK